MRWLAHVRFLQELSGDRERSPPPSPTRSEREISYRRDKRLSFKRSFERYARPIPIADVPAARRDNLCCAAASFSLTINSASRPAADPPADSLMVRSHIA
ncbi:hypothetical protein BIWAKO_06039 [Bosea sp. BIWAKO-01]|nr:hypothetical protein BIWAKO_06039 [Bosea sp. BIWAKO-01]